VEESYNKQWELMKKGKAKVESFHQKTLEEVELFSESNKLKGWLKL
jgi:hypothetical protein